MAEAAGHGDAQGGAGASGVPRSPRLFLVAGEHSGDALGAKLMAAIKASTGGSAVFAGVGGEAMESEGLASLFPMHDVAVMGPLAILKRLPRIVRRVYETVDAAVAARPDAVVIIDSPEFTHPIAKRIRRRVPDIPIIDYVSPTVWAWRPGRARKMRPYVDHVLALLPFEPEAHRRLGGPECSYVGHPLIERLEWMSSLDPEPLARRLGLDAARPVLVVLPGSRPSEVSRLLGPFGAAVGMFAAYKPAPQIIIPTVASVRDLVSAGVADWAMKPMLIEGEEDKFRAFMIARAALAASGTVTLELALAGTPAVVAYKVDSVASSLRFLLKVPTVVLANLVAGENIYPEFLQEGCTPERLAEAVRPLLDLDSVERERQRGALARVPPMLRLAQGTPSEAAAGIVLGLIDRQRG